MSQGCHFLASNTTAHRVIWPWGFIVPGFVTERANTNTGGTNEIRRPCAPPPPPPSDPYCDDPSGDGCSSTGTATGPQSGGVVTREMGRSGGYKTVCYVTDWFENGVYVETTIDRCWTEPIY